MISTDHAASSGRGLAAGTTFCSQAVRACVRAHDWSCAPTGLADLLPQLDGHDLLAAARRHRVSGCVRASVRHLPGALPADVLDGFEADADSQLAQHMRALGVVHLLTEALDPVIGPWVVVKGPVLAGHVYDRPDLRSYRDVDVLVRPDELGAAISALEDAGCELLDRNWTLLRRKVVGEVHLLTPMGMIVDLHWSLLYGEGLRRTFVAPTGELLDRSVQVRLGGSSVRTLDPLDTLVHLALHAAMSGGDRMVWLKDIEQAWGHVDPGQVRERAKTWRARLPVAAMLARTTRVLGLDTGGASVTRMLPRAVSGVLSAVEAREDFVVGGEVPTARRVVTRAMRRDAGSSLFKAARRATARVRTGSPPSSDPSDPSGSVLFDSGGPDGRRAYLEQVARWR